MLFASVFLAVASVSHASMNYKAEKESCVMAKEFEIIDGKIPPLLIDPRFHYDERYTRVEVQICGANMHSNEILPELTIAFDNDQSCLSISGAPVAYGILRNNDFIIRQRFEPDGYSERNYYVLEKENSSDAIDLLPSDIIFAVISTEAYLSQWENLENLFLFARSRRNEMIGAVWQKLEAKDKAFMIEFPLGKLMPGFRTIDFGSLALPNDAFNQKSMGSLKYDKFIKSYRSELEKAKKFQQRKANPWKSTAHLRGLR